MNSFDMNSVSDKKSKWNRIIKKYHRRESKVKEGKGRNLLSLRHPVTKVVSACRGMRIFGVYYLLSAKETGLTYLVE